MAREAMQQELHAYTQKEYAKLAHIYFGLAALMLGPKDVRWKDDEEGGQIGTLTVQGSRLVEQIYCTLVTSANN